VTAGKLFAVNSAGSATGTGAVGVSGTGVLNLAGPGPGPVPSANAGSVSGPITLSSGGSLYSGGVMAGAPATGAGTGAQLTSALNVNGGGLTFALSNGGTGTFANPVTTTSYISTSAQVSFTGNVTINLVDLSNGGLTLRQSSPYLLIGSSLGDAGFSGLVTMDASGHQSLDGDGYVLGVMTGGTAGNYTYSALTFNQFGSDGVTPLTGAAAYPAGLQLYLNNGDLEVVPEPGTWVLMLGGLGVLILWQRRKNSRYLSLLAFRARDGDGPDRPRYPSR
jgi:hypothetical protein